MERGDQQYACGLHKVVRLFHLHSLSYLYLYRSEYFHTLEACWNVLYSKDWSTIIIPDLHRLLQTRGDIRIDSPSNVEDIERVLHRLGIVPSSSSSDLSPPSPVRDPSCHMTHADVYSCIFDTVIRGEMSCAKKLRLEAYLNRNVYSIR